MYNLHRSRMFGAARTHVCLGVLEMMMTTRRYLVGGGERLLELRGCVEDNVALEAVLLQLLLGD